MKNEAYTGSRNEAYGTSSLVWVAPDTYLAVKTIIKTISIYGAASVDDYKFAADANNTEQSKSLGAIIPAYADIIGAQLVCFETVSGSGSEIVGLELGTVSGGGQLLATADRDAAGDMSTGAAGASPLIGATNAAKTIWITGKPTANWSTLTAGRWAITITYIDNGAVYIKKSL